MSVLGNALVRASVLTIIIVAASFNGCGWQSGEECSTRDGLSSSPGGAAESIEIGAATRLDNMGDQPFLPLNDGEEIRLVRGEQGADMIGLRFRLAGAEVPACVSHDTTVADAASGSTITTVSLSLETFPEGDGTRATRPLWLPGAYPERIQVRVKMLGHTVTRELRTVPQLGCNGLRDCVSACGSGDACCAQQCRDLGSIDARRMLNELNDCVRTQCTTQDGGVLPMDGGSGDPVCESCEPRAQACARSRP
jgi:hypothetical protein